MKFICIMKREFYDMRKRKNDGSRLTIVLVVIAVLLCAAIFFAGGYLGSVMN